MIGYTYFFEQPNYILFQQLSTNVDIREYNERTFAEGWVNGTGMPARRHAFRLLLSYISGANDAAKKINMTIPVSASGVNPSTPENGPPMTSLKKNKYRMRFFLPRAYNLGSAPTPNNPQVSIGFIPARLEAVLRYTGSQSDSRAKMHEGRLFHTLNSSKWKPTGPPVALFYNPPFSIPFLRRNEITVPVTLR